MKKNHDLNPQQIDRIIEMAWEDRTPFDAIKLLSNSDFWRHGPINGNFLSGNRTYLRKGYGSCPSRQSKAVTLRVRF